MSHYRRFLFLSMVLLITGSGCDSSPPPGETVITQSPQPVQEVDRPRSDALTDQAQPRQFDIGNRRYLFVLEDHSIDELQDLLARADRIAQDSLEAFDQLEIAMVIHGPTVNNFTRESYPGNRGLIDLAARLDAYNVIDLKICEDSMSSQGVDRSDVPAFIDSVPFAPDEIERLTSEGYITL